MASSVFYKFASQRNESRVTFDGTGIAVFDLKREIIIANNLSKANDFDLIALDPTSKQEFTDDSHIIPRSSSVVVKRVPLPKGAKSKVAVYPAGTAGTAGVASAGDAGRGPMSSATPPTWNRGAMSKRFDGKDDPQNKSATPQAPAPVADLPSNAITTDDEKAALAAMFQAQSANWEETQEKMSHAQRIYTNPRGTGFQRGGKPFGAPHQNDRPLPPSYVCYRCGQKGHWIQDCPTNSDREFDNRPRIKRTTGIPRSMLKAVANPSGPEMTQGVMVTPEGSYVVAQPDLASWQKKTHRSAGLTVEQVRERTPTDSTLICPIDNKLFRDAVKTPCCEKTYCEECVQTHLLERDFVCPNCSKKVASLDKLLPDKSMRAKVHEYIDKAIEESRKEMPEELMAKDVVPAENPATSEAVNTEQDIYSDQPQQPDDLGFDGMSQLVESIPQLQASIAQLSIMLQNPSLPNHVRSNTEMQLNQLQMELTQAQTFQAAFAAATSLQQSGAFNNMNGMQGFQQQTTGMYGGQFANQPQQQQPDQDSAYQRLPVNNRRRNLKRDRPSDFLEVGGDNDAKVARYWE